MSWVRLIRDADNRSNMFHEGAHCLRIQFSLTFLGMQEPAYVEATCSILGHAFRLHPSNIDGCARHRRGRRKNGSVTVPAAASEGLASLGTGSGVQMLAREYLELNNAVAELSFLCMWPRTANISVYKRLPSSAERLSLVWSRLRKFCSLAVGITIRPLLTLILLLATLGSRFQRMLVHER